MKIEWEPTEFGTTLWLDDTKFDLDTLETVTLRNDMEEAFQLSTGFEPHEVMAEDVELHDRLFVSRIPLLVENVLTDYKGYTIIQGRGDTMEVRLPGDATVRVWRRIA